MTKQEAVELISKMYISANTKDKRMQLRQALEIAIESLKAEPVKHGRWIKGVDEYNGDKYCKCSECGYLNLECEVFDLDGFRYCPNCGAKMDEVEND